MAPQHIDKFTLRDWIVSAQKSGKPLFAIIDVRDDDHIGVRLARQIMRLSFENWTRLLTTQGHIIRSENVPSTKFATALPALYESHKNTPLLVFHCALSQQRGPSSAAQYMRYLERFVVFLFGFLWSMVLLT